ncbi:sulfotransferase family 2 domain-containing protein [Aestuariivita boseongensis]|uniref:sulfotransferase family 2 domain-containing protein n=1 Tax=Aestuariivita boseongensis TaxID=1470562 RepID=UPI0006817053|nr:sulfotransferase family 2 domain-containing protein [Aestuariivita boseongensis]
MIVSKGRGYVFVHIPKTGGTAMALALEARAMKDDVMIGDTPKALKRRRKVDASKAAGRVWKHATLADIDGLFSVAEIEALFAFTLVRNPWDRVVSYYHWLREQSFDHPAVALSKAHDFAGFLGQAQIQESLRASPYAQYMTRADGVEQCQAYVRLEHLAEDLQPVEDHLGFRLEMPHANRSDRDAGYRGYFSDETAAIVADVCAPDIKRFGYTF